MTINTKVERRGARERNVGGPTRPTPPGKNIGGRHKAGRPRSYAAAPSTLPPGLLNLPHYPSPDAPTLAALAGIPDPAHKATQAANYIMHAIACGAPHSHIENQIGLQPGSLVALLLSDRELSLQYCVAENGAANFEDSEARRILATVVGQPVPTAAARTVLNFVNSLRTAAEGRRRLSEALLRKNTLAVREHGSRESARFRKLWDRIMGATNAFAPAASIEVTVTASEPLAAAHELIPQLRGDLDARRAAGEPGVQLLALADQVRRVEQFIKRHTTGSQPAQQRQATPSAPPWIAPQPKKPKPVRRHKTLDQQFQATAEHQRSQTEPGTVQYLKEMLAWAEAHLPKEDALVVRQLASLRGRVCASDLDAAGNPEAEIAKTADQPSSPVTQSDQPAKDVASVGNIHFKLKADPSASGCPPTRPKSNPELANLRARAQRARREAYGFPAHAAVVRNAQQLEAQLAEMEAKMQSP